MEYTRPLRYEFPLVRGEDVRAVQQALIALHLDPSCGSADGVFGNMTALALKAFQHHYNTVSRGSNAPIPESGEVERDTWGALFGRASDVNATASRIQMAAAALDGSTPGSAAALAPCLNAAQVKRVREVLAAEPYGSAIAAAARDIGVDVNLIYAIACQETANVWLAWIDKQNMSLEQVLPRCVFDASGDAPPTVRKAFPSNTAAFRARYGEPLTQLLIDEANATRQLRGYKTPKAWVYKGYGIFQYDLQNIQTDEEFFKNRQWGDIHACLDRLTRELRDKRKLAKDLPDLVRLYNGAGEAALRYSADVMQMREWCA